MKIHIVQKGDTLWKIAQKYGVDFQQLKAMNTHLSNPDMIMPGMKINIPTTSGTVKKEFSTQLQPKKEYPIVDHPFKEQPPPAMQVKEQPIMQPPKEIKEVPQPIYIPKYPQPIIPEIDINNYYMLNMAKMQMEQSIKEQPKEQPLPPPKEMPEEVEMPEAPMESPVFMPQPMLPPCVPCIPMTPVLPGTGLVPCYGMPHMMQPMMMPQAAPYISQGPAEMQNAWPYMSQPGLSAPYPQMPAADQGTEGLAMGKDGFEDGNLDPGQFPAAQMPMQLYPGMAQPGGIQAMPAAPVFPTQMSDCGCGGQMSYPSQTAMPYGGMGYPESFMPEQAQMGTPTQPMTPQGSMTYPIQPMMPSGYWGDVAGQQQGMNWPAPPPTGWGTPWHTNLTGPAGYQQTMPMNWGNRDPFADPVETEDLLDEDDNSDE